MTIRWFLVVAMLLCFQSHAPGGESSRRKRFDEIKAEFDKQFAAFVMTAREAKTDPEREAAQKRRPSLNAYGKRFLALAEEQPADEVSCDALVWIASNYGRREKMELDRALDLIEKHHVRSPKLKNVVDSLAYADVPRATALLETIAEKA